MNVMGPPMYAQKRGNYVFWVASRDKILCKDPLDAYVNIPSIAKTIWVELSDKQWIDKSGTKISICFTKSLYCYGVCSVYVDGVGLLYEMGKFLTKKILKFYYYLTVLMSGW